MTTVLLVEDEPSLRRATARILANCGYAVVQASDGQDALNDVARMRDVLSAMGSSSDGIDVVVSDLDMPKVDGMELHDRLPDSLRRKMVFYTARPEAFDNYKKTCQVVRKGDTEKLLWAIKYALEVLS